MKTNILNNLNFYKKYFRKSQVRAEDFKGRYIMGLTQNRIYKYIQFSEDKNLNKIKLNTLRNKQLWFGCFWTMNDPTEFSMPKLGTEFASEHEEKWYDMQIAYLKEEYNLCSFTYGNSQGMWDSYGNNGNGFCLCFEIEDYDWFYPIEYVSKKDEYSFVPLWRKANSMANRKYNNNLPNIAMALLPYFIKDKINIQTNLDSSLEKEIRAIYCSYSEDNENNGILIPGYHKENNIRGNNVAWNKLNLHLEKIILGKKCNTENELALYDFAKQNEIIIEKQKGEFD